MKRIEIVLRHLLLKIYLFFKRPAEKNKKLKLNNNLKILFIRLNRIGDALVSTPLYSIIKKKLGCKIYILADKKNHFVFENNSSIDKVIIFPRGFGGINYVRKFITEEDIDTIVDLHDDVSTTVSFIVGNSKVQNKIGFKKSNHKLYTHTVEKPDRSTTHIIERNLAILKLFNLNYDNEEVSVVYNTKEESVQRATELLKDKIDTNKFTLGINISAGSEARFWGIENYNRLLSELRNYNINLLLLGAEKDEHYLKEITQDNNIIFPPTSDFDLFAAVISELNMLFTPDTSVVHIASIKKIPVFGIYVHYKTDELIWSPYNTDFECIMTEEPTLKNVKFEEVKSKFIPFLEKQLNAKRNSIL